MPPTKAEGHANPEYLFRYTAEYHWRSYPLDLVDKSRGGTLLEGGKM